MVIGDSTSAEYGLSKSTHTITPHTPHSSHTLTPYTALFPLHSREEPSPDVDNLVRLNYTTSYTVSHSPGL